VNKAMLVRGVFELDNEGRELGRKSFEFLCGNIECVGDTLSGANPPQFGGGGVLRVSGRVEYFRYVRAGEIEKRTRLHVIADRGRGGADILDSPADLADAVPIGNADGDGEKESEEAESVQFLANRNRHWISLPCELPIYCSLRTVFTVSSTSSFFT
jgi:hypothetical protein